MIDLTIDDMLLYSQCPMRYNFSAFLGIDEYTSTFTGQLEEVMRKTMYSFFNRVGDPQIIPHTMRTYNTLSSRVQIPAEDRGSPRRKETYKSRIEEAREVLRFACTKILSLPVETVVLSPYTYELNIEGALVVGYFDAVVVSSGTTHVMVMDMNRTYPSDEFLSNGIRCTIAHSVYRKLFPEDEKYKVVHFNLYNTAYEIVNRTEAQIRSCDYELRSIISAMNNTTSTGLWYRSKSQICNTCYANVPCDEIYRRLCSNG
jgi:hypothetical protein